MGLRLFTLAIVTIIALDSANSQKSSEAITAFEIRQHIRFLASDSLDGRLTGTAANRLAAEYIANQFERFGLPPVPGKDYFQEFDFVQQVKLGKGNSMVVSNSNGSEEFVVDKDFRPFGFSTNASVEGTLVFAGYGISAPEKGYDDYANTDVSGKIVIVLRYSPDGTNPHGELQEFSSFRNKARYAREKGALAVILINGEIDDPDDDLVPLRYDHSMATSGLPMIQVKRRIVEKIMKSAGLNLRSIQDSINATRKPISFAIPENVRVSINTDLEQIKGKSANVAGFLRGGKAQNDQVLAIGAHFDHLGHGGEGSGSLSPDEDAVHNGADDNASGTAGLLELAQFFAGQRNQLNRSILFLAFSGEELGLLGSSHYVQHPLVPLENTIAMINMDMIGRLQESRKLTVYGTATSSNWEAILTKENHTSEHDSLFALSFIADGFGPSDHSSFYGKNIPVLFFFTGTHNDYHKPSDDWDLINYDGEETVLRYIQTVAEDILQSTERPAYVNVPSSSSRGNTRGFKVTLGVIPDYGETPNGMKIGGVRADGPAARAGLLGGDVIVKMAGKDVLNIYDYMAILGELSAGDIVEVEVMRNGDRMKLSATMQKR